jgi:hypothetical protein
MEWNTKYNNLFLAKMAANKGRKKNIFGQTPLLRRSTLNYLVTGILNQINIKSGNMEFIALISFVIAAVGYWLYVSNQPRQQSTPKETLDNYSANHPTYPIQKHNKQFLVLVVAAEKADLVHLMKTKGYISPDDGTKLYELTKYLWLGSESDFIKKVSNTKDYLVAKDKESEFDNYLVYLELKQSDKGFKPNVGQLARYDAFRKLADLKVNFEISPRLQMEAYSNFELYSR